MSDFKAKMHQIRFRWGTALDPPAYSAPPDATWIKRSLILRGEWEGRWVGVKEMGG